MVSLPDRFPGTKEQRPRPARSRDRDVTAPSNQRLAEGQKVIASAVSVSAERSFWLWNSPISAGRISDERPSVSAPHGQMPVELIDSVNPRPRHNPWLYCVHNDPSKVSPFCLSRAARRFGMPRNSFTPLTVEPTTSPLSVRAAGGGNESLVAALNAETIVTT